MTPVNGETLPQTPADDARGGQDQGEPRKDGEQVPRVQQGWRRELRRGLQGRAHGDKHRLCDEGSVGPGALNPPPCYVQ